MHSSSACLADISETDNLDHSPASVNINNNYHFSNLLFIQLNYLTGTNTIGYFYIKMKITQRAGRSYSFSSSPLYPLARLQSRQFSFICPYHVSVLTPPVRPSTLHVVYINIYIHFISQKLRCNSRQ